MCCFKARFDCAHNLHLPTKSGIIRKTLIKEITMIKLPKMYTANSIKAMHEKLNLDAQTVMLLYDAE